MKFLQRIVSHGMIIGILAVAVLGYWYRADLLPERFKADSATPAVVKLSAEKINPPALPTGGNKPSVQQEPVAPSANSLLDLPPMQEDAATLAKQTQESGITGIAETAPPAWDAAVAESVTTESTTSVEEYAADTDVNNLPPMQKTDSELSSVESDQTQIPATSQLGTAQISTLEANNSHSPLEYDAAQVARELQAARVAFWQHDFTAAEEQYQHIISADAENADARGELGNVYFQQGNWELAANAYYAAAQLLLAEGDYQRVHYILPVLRGLNAQRASELESALRQQYRPG